MADDLTAWGPLGALAGEWEGEGGMDFSYHNVEGEVGETPYREKITFKPFGPVDNGDQHLYGLDYRMAAWRAGEDDPFHTEVGYWLWDAGNQQVMRCFMVPRGSVLIAGCTANADGTTFTMEANLGDPTYGVLSNKYLDAQAKTTKYECTITVHDANSWSYQECTYYEHTKGGKIAHTDHNTLRRVG